MKLAEVQPIRLDDRPRGHAIDRADPKYASIAQHGALLSIFDDRDVKRTADPAMCGVDAEHTIHIRAERWCRRGLRR